MSAKELNQKSNDFRRCLVLGGRGFIGSHLIDALLQRGYSVRCFDRPQVMPLGDSHLMNKNFELYEGDFLSNADILAAVDGCDVCYHLVSTTAPQSSNADPIFDIETNVLGTVRLLLHGLEAGLKKVVFVSSGGTVYGVPEHIPIPETHPTNPMCSYGITKLAIEKYLRLFNQLNGLEYTVLRLANPFGERQRTNASQGAVAVFLSKALQGKTIDIWGDGSVVRDYIHISDVVSALLAALDHSGTERIFNIGSGKGISLNDVLDSIDRVIGHKTKRHYMNGRAFDVPANVLCIDRAANGLNWKPSVSFEEGLIRFANWLHNSSEI